MRITGVKFCLESLVIGKNVSDYSHGHILSYGVERILISCRDIFMVQKWPLYEDYSVGVTALLQNKLAEIRIFGKFRDIFTYVIGRNINGFTPAIGCCKTDLIQQFFHHS